MVKWVSVVDRSKDFSPRDVYARFIDVKLRNDLLIRLLGY